jgi:hypothetical protein
MGAFMNLGYRVLKFSILALGFLVNTLLAAQQKIGFLEFINLYETNSLGVLEDKLIHYRIHSEQAIGGMTENIEKYIELNTNLLEGKPNIKNSISSFKDLRYILNKIEINLEIQNEISKIETKDFDNTNYIAILKNKHKIYLEYGFAKWPLLSSLRKFKKLFTA